MIKSEQNQSGKLTIAVGLSGGVDSAVTALLLKEQGHRVMGIFMQNWSADNEHQHCSVETDLSDARSVAHQLDIPLYTVNFEKIYWNDVFQHCLNEFNAGRTPNPDVWCNQRVKFKVLLEHAIHLGADYLATGHYAQLQKVDGYQQLRKSEDTQKDQTYFLYLLNQYQLSHACFPLGHYQKHTIRDIARRAGLINAEKKDSTGICFIGKRQLKPFLKTFLLEQPGAIETTTGKVIGQHDGLMFHTLGQRKGLRIGGQANSNHAPWYVLEKDMARNILIVGQGRDHPRLYAHALICNQVHWIKGNTPPFPLSCTAKVRYLQQEQACTVTATADNACHVRFNKPQWALTPGQSIVFYQNHCCLGGGIIESSKMPSI